ncbi:ABC transporter substrate-binding protein [Parasulfuritortus cantonensis]|uniref:ABC transporter substrate-binding protein n=1 Tax=Parasulfuritortus cantonensis TaxID=2528202 RepID=UPI001404E762|nr:ABC transporter substrate-binding protein [Parasulfuritortus cantonensis]
MQRQLAACLLVLSSSLATPPASAREVVDMAGRTVSVPDVVERPFGAAPPLTALLYALDPSLVHSLNMAFTPGSEHMLRPGTMDLPVLGSAMGHGKQVNPEALLALKPDLALGWLNDKSDLPPAGIEAPFRKVGVPLVYVRLETLADWPPAFEYVGRLVGREARGKQLADYIRRAMARVDQAVARVPAGKRVSVYYAETPDGLATDCDTSFHSEPIALAGGANVYRCEQRTMYGQERVDMERILLWNPQVIVAQDPMFIRTAAGDPRWQRIAALKSGRVLDVPRKPMNWLDRPPSFMRALGIQWLANAFYPDRYRIDMRAETRTFYRLFFGAELSDADLDELLGGGRR